MNPELVRQRLRKGEEVLRALRPVMLIWGSGDPRTSVEAREGIPERMADFENAGYRSKRRCKFYVLRELVPVPPKIDQVLTIQGRADKWRVMEIPSGDAGSDLLWIFDCQEE